MCIRNHRDHLKKLTYKVLKIQSKHCSGFDFKYMQAKIYPHEANEPVKPYHRSTDRVFSNDFNKVNLLNLFETKGIY